MWRVSAWSFSGRCGFSPSQFTAASWWGGYSGMNAKEWSHILQRDFDVFINTIGRRYYNVGWWDVGRQYSPKVRESTWKIRDRPRDLGRNLEMCHQHMESASSRVRLPPSHATRNVSAWVLFVSFMESITWSCRSWGKVVCRRSCDGDGSWHWLCISQEGILNESYVIIWRKDVLLEWWYYKANQVVSIVEHWGETMLKTIRERFRYCDGIRSEARYRTQCTWWNGVVTILLLHCV